MRPVTTGGVGRRKAYEYGGREATVGPGTGGRVTAGKTGMGGREAFRFCALYFWIPFGREGKPSDRALSRTTRRVSDCRQGGLSTRGGRGREAGLPEESTVG